MTFDETLWFLNLSLEKIFSINDSVEVRGVFACSDLINEALYNVQDVVSKWVVMIEGGRLICYLGR